MCLFTFLEHIIEQKHTFRTTSALFYQKLNSVSSIKAMMHIWSDMMGLDSLTVGGSGLCCAEKKLSHGAPPGLPLW